MKRLFFLQVFSLIFSIVSCVKGDMSAGKSDAEWDGVTPMPEVVDLGM